MTIYLQDNFARTGTLSGSAPDTVANSGALWAGSSNLVCASGRVTANFDMWTCAIDAATTTVLTNQQLRFSILTGSSVAFAADYPLATVSITLGDAVFELALGTNSSSAKQIIITTGTSYTGHGPYAVTLAANATYPVVIDVTPGAQSITAFGTTYPFTEAYSTTSALMTVSVACRPTVDIGPVYFGAPIAPDDTGAIDFSLPMITSSAAGHPVIGSVAGGAVLPSLSALALGHDSSGDQAAAITLPALSVAIATGANAELTLPKLSAPASATATNYASAEITLPSLSPVISGTVAATAQADISLPAFTSASYAGALISVNLGSVTLQATGTTGGVASAQITLPLFEATAVAAANNYGSAAIVLPSLAMGASVRAAASLPSLSLTAIGTAVVTATYEAYAVNLKHTPRPGVEPVDETTRYTNFPFTHVVRHLKSYYGVNGTGLYLLEGTTDDATPIPWAVKTAMTDFKSPEKKTVASAYFGGRFGPASTVQLHAGEQAPNTYSYSTPRDALAQNHRQAFGKGLKERYYALGASGAGVCEIDSIELDVHKTTRRI